MNRRAASFPVLIFLLACASTAVAQQPPPTAPKQASKLLALTGCISANPNQPGGYLLSDSEQGADYRLTGTNVRDYAGQRVEISGTAPKRLQIVGGLYPSPNIAAQGNDPTKVGVAAAGGPGGTSGKPLSEFRVKSIRPVAGSCPAQ